MMDKNHPLLRRLSKHEHTVAFRFPSHFLHTRFNKIRAKDQQRTDLIDFFRMEVFQPAARFAYRASQIEYIGDQEIPQRLWAKAKRMCMHACSRLDVVLDDGFVTLRFNVVTHMLVEERDLHILLDAVEAQLSHEQYFYAEQEKRRLEFHPDSKPDKYEEWRSGVYSDIQKALMNATFLREPNQGIYLIQSTMI